MDEKDAEHSIIEITKIEIKETYDQSSISGKDREGKELVFRFLPFTRIHRLSPQDSTRTVADVLREAGRLPLEVDQEVLVTWKPYPHRGQIAIKLTIY